jgi:hypothetical protein
MQTLAQRRGQRLAARDHDLRAEPESAGELLVGERRNDRGVAVQMVGPELVEARHQLRERLGHAEREHPVDADVERLGPTAAHVGGRGAADHGAPQARQPRTSAGAAEEHRGHARPAGAVVEKTALRPDEPLEVIALYSSR